MRDVAPIYAQIRFPFAPFVDATDVEAIHNFNPNEYILVNRW